MPKSKLAKSKTTASTQQYLDIAEIRDNVVILRDGSLRSVLLASSINFALKSEDEQNAIIQGYISFLNSLDFPLQIVVQSRRLNIDKYLEDLKAQQKKQTNELLRTQIEEYHGFIQEMVTLGEIMGKRFYITVPYAPGKGTRKGFFAEVGAIFTPVKILKISDQIFKKYRSRLESRVEKVASGLSGFGVTAIPLDTQGLIELFYMSYNVELAALQKIPSKEKLQVEE